MHKTGTLPGLILKNPGSVGVFLYAIPAIIGLITVIFFVVWYFTGASISEQLAISLTAMWVGTGIGLVMFTGGAFVLWEGLHDRLIVRINPAEGIVQVKDGRGTRKYKRSEIKGIYFERPYGTGTGHPKTRYGLKFEKENLALNRGDLQIKSDENMHLLIYLSWLCEEELRGEMIAEMGGTY